MASAVPVWQEIAHRKQAERHARLHQPQSISVTVPPHLLPIDPPSPTAGHQAVTHIPAQLLSSADQEITSLPLPTLLSRLASRSLTATAVCTAYIRRASITHQLTNCLTEVLFTRALEHAAELDAHIQRTGKPLGPLHGLPMSVKDTFNIAGYDSTTGLASLCFKPAKEDAPLVQLLEQDLGAVVIAKTNVPQTMASLDSVNNVFGRTYNPLNRLLTAGGSSGGEGVMVAMRGSAVGIGTDIGGSIRVPAMCNGVVGVKPGLGRFPYGGQAAVGLEGVGRLGVQAVAGPIARNISEAELVLREVVERSWLYGEDCVGLQSGHWRAGEEVLKGSGNNGEFVIGVLKGDGNCAPLPPIADVIDEVALALSKAGVKGLKIQVVDVPTPAAWTKSQSLMSKLMGFDGGAVMSKLIQETNEPLVPWMKTRFKHNGKAVPLERAAQAQTQRAQLERDFTEAVWSQVIDGKKRRRIDALICPVAAHPVPEIERYNAVGYTSSWVMFDYPAGCIPVRQVKESDLRIGEEFGGKVLSSWDEKNRELWDEKKMDRKVYVGSPLSVQVVTARGEDERLVAVMKVIEEVLQKSGSGSREMKL